MGGLERIEWTDGSLKVLSRPEKCMRKSCENESGALAFRARKPHSDVYFFILPPRKWGSDGWPAANTTHSIPLLRSQSQ